MISAHKNIFTLNNNIFLLIIILLTTLSSCNKQFTDKEKNLILSADFNNRKSLIFSKKDSRQLRFGKGIEGRGLNLEKSSTVPTLQNYELEWFSNENDFSVSVWLKSDKLISDTTIILSNSNFRKEDAGIYGRRRTNKGFTLYCYNGAWGWNIGNGRLHYLYEPVVEDQPVADNKWHQIVFTYNSTLKEISLFYDGINKSVLSIGDLSNRDFMSSLPLRIGKNINGSDHYGSFQGIIDDLQVWNKTLSTVNIKTEYEKYFNVADEPESKLGEITIVNWNIWHGGTHFTQEKDGFDGIDRITKLIKSAGADIVLMQETYGAGSKISSSLGFYYYEASSTIGAVWGANLSVMSRFPLEDAYMIEERSNYGKNYAFNNGGVKVRLNKNKSVIAFSNWYNGGKPEDLEGALNGWSNLIQNSNDVPIIFGGDFNSVSHLDDGIGKSGHSKLMTNAGFIDSYRSKHPDIINFPGYSNGGYSSRIDYIYYKGDKLELIESGPIIPNFKGREEKTPGYPSDHLGIVAKFKVN